MSKVYVLGSAQTDFERNWKKEGKGIVAHTEGSYGGWPDACRAQY